MGLVLNGPTHSHVSVGSFCWYLVGDQRRHELKLIATSELVYSFVRILMSGSNMHCSLFVNGCRCQEGIPLKVAEFLSSVDLSGSAAAAGEAGTHQSRRVSDQRCTFSMLS